MRLGGDGDWIDMKQAEGQHVWTANLAANPETGTRRIEIQTTDMYGQTFTDYRMIRVE